MAFEFAGIENIGEFYSGHYLSAVLEGDLKSTFEKWRQAKEEEGRRLPQEALAGLANRYFAIRAKAEEESEAGARLDLAREFNAYFVEALGYERKPGIEPLEGDEIVPVHLALRKDGNPFLWILDAPFPETEDEDPLASSPLEEQLPNGSDGAKLPESQDNKGEPASWREILDERLFRLEHSPRWVMFLAGSEVLLIERYKWPQGKYLRFDLGELFGRKQASVLRAMAGLLHKDVLVPDSGICLHDTLDENSHKHAYAVSGDLKHGVRRAVELLANEAVWYRREKQKQAVFNEEELAPKLTSECLTYLYRLLFLFYVEARGSELGAVPMEADAYRKGYSLESLRDLELVPLTTEHARNGYYIHDSLKILFRMLDRGFPDPQKYPELRKSELSMDLGDQYRDDIEITAMNSPLFDDDRLDILKGVKFRNHVLQQVLQLLSLSAEKKRKTRGRISYAQLGINQLGAVYEGLLSYTGFFANEDMYEVASEKECKNLSGKPAAEREALKTYFVPESRIADYKEAEIVKDEDGRKVKHPKGSFIFRLAGRNREKSASYYTPEVLTKCLVKYALKELLWEEGEEGQKPTRKKTADEILALTICEPAMGSSAFLIEAVDQLADAYLEARQEELGGTIPPEDYQREKRRVKARLATNNCYGVDLNPTAVELAKVSLWLATLHEDGKCPWFGLRLATGNSLVGARREVFKTADVTRKGTKDAPNWLGLVPEPVPLHHGEDSPPPDEVDWANWTAPPRPKGTIYHFLLPAEGMAAFDKDKVIKQLAPESVKRIKEWRKEFCKPFNRKDAERLEKISDAVDRLFAQVVRERVLATQETSDRIPVWGEPPSAQQADLLVRDQEEVAASLEDGSSAYRRLKLAMDAWCALWFWPIEEAGLLPDRATWLAQMELILKGQVTHEEVWQQQTLFAALGPQGEMESGQRTWVDPEAPAEASAERLKRLQALSDAFRERRTSYFEECGLADIDAVLEGEPSLREAQATADRLHFHHWPLRFAEAFGLRGGFDLILGNPPWIKLGFSDPKVLADLDPRVLVHELSVPEVASLRENELLRATSRRIYVEEYGDLAGYQSFFGARENYRRLEGVQSNLYKCFLLRAWSEGNTSGIVALLHPEGIFEDPKGGSLRAEIYPRLRMHAQFSNELKLFPEIGNRNKFSINCYACDPSDSVHALHVSNLFHPFTLEASDRHDGLGPIPLLKDDSDNWDLAGHAHRLIRVDDTLLGVFASFYEGEGTPPVMARLPMVHAKEVVEVLRTIGLGRRVCLRDDAWATTREWHEGDRQADGTIRREVCFPADLESLIFSGPHIYVANPLYQTPNEGCDSHRAYTAIDLDTVAADFLPRTVYLADRSSAAYARKLPRWQGRSLFSRYRHAHRKRAGTAGERTLIPAILPAGSESIATLTTIAFADNFDMVLTNALCSSLLADFSIRSTGRGDIFAADLERVPALDRADPLVLPLITRCMRLNCVSHHYRDLWGELFEEKWGVDAPCQVDRRFAGWDGLARSWREDSALRTHLERRQAEVEIDVLVALGAGLSVNELVAIYRIQFPVLGEHDRDARYDQHGRVIPASKTAAGNPAVSLVELAATLKEQAGFDVHAEYHPDGSNTQELRRQKIRLGKKEADVLGVSERCTMADLLAETEVRWSDEDHPEGRPVRLVGLRYTDPGLEPRMERVYPTPWTRCDREADYRHAWAEFERRLGKKMPEGTAL